MENQFARLLQPLRITDGWMIEYNIFTHFEPTEEDAKYTYGEWLFIVRDDKHQVGMDLRFEPEGDPSGYFVLDFYRIQLDSTPNQIPIKEIRKRKKKEIVFAIEYWLCKGTSGEVVE